MKNLLAFRFGIFNALMLCLAVALWINGYVQPIFETDSSRLSYGIAALFVIGWLGVAREIIVASGGLNRNKLLGARPAIEAEAGKDLAKVDWLDYTTELLVGLGLLGTVIGFKVSLGSIDQGSISSATGAQSAVALLMEGLNIAINTTILGASLAFWHGINCRLLRTALSIYWADRLAANDGIGNIRSLD